MCRVKELKEATNRMLDNAESVDDAYSIALLILGCIVRDEPLDETRCNLPDYPIFTEILRQRNDALRGGDDATIAAIKADAEAALEHGRKRAVEMAVQRFWDSLKQTPNTTEKT